MLKETFQRMCGLKKLLALFPGDWADAAMMLGLIPSRISCVPCVCALIPLVQQNFVIIIEGNVEQK